MTNHTVWGHASDALYTLHSKNAAEMEYAPDEPITLAVRTGPLQRRR